MNDTFRIHFWAHMLDEAFCKNDYSQHINEDAIKNGLDKEYFSAILDGDLKHVRRLVNRHADNKFSGSCIDDVIYHGSQEDNMFQFDIDKAKGNFLYCFDDKYSAKAYSGVEDLRFLPTQEFSIEVNDMDAYSPWSNLEFSQNIWKNSLKIIPVLMKDNKFITGFDDDACLMPITNSRYDHDNTDYDDVVLKVYSLEDALKAKIKLSNLDQSILDKNAWWKYIPVQARDKIDVEFFVVDIETGQIFKDMLEARTALRKRIIDQGASYEKAGVYPLYVLAKNPFTFDADGDVWNGLEFNGEQYQTTDDIADYAAQHGHDVVLIDNVEDNPEGGIEAAGVCNEIIVMVDPKFVKSAKLVTYDDDAKIIPLSKRFDFSVNDIRF